MNPKKRKPNLETILALPAHLEVKHAFFLNKFLLLFCSEYHNGAHTAAVYKFDIFSKILIRIHNLHGPAKHLISFRNDKHNYILQRNGSLWLILHSSHSGRVEFKFLAQLWNFTKKLHGALTFQTKLIIFGNHPRSDPPDELTVTELPDHFKEISYWGNKFCCSSFVPIIVAKKALRPSRKKIEFTI